MRLLVGNRAHDAALAIGQLGDRDAGLGPQRRAPPLRGHDELAGEFIVADPNRGPVCRARDHRFRRREHLGGGQGVQLRVQRHPQAARLHHPAERPGTSLRMVEMQKQRRGGAARFAVRHPDVQDRARFERQALPNARRLQHGARPGGDGIGAAVEIRVFHRRQRRAVDHRHPHPTRRQAAGERRTHRAGAHHAYVRFKLIHRILPSF